MQYRLGANESVSINPSLVALLVFGGKDPETKHTDYHNAFEIAFRKEKWLEAWAKVGAAPLTRSCIASDNVRYECGVVGDTFEKITRTCRRVTTRVARGWISKYANPNCWKRRYKKGIWWCYLERYLIQKKVLKLLPKLRPWRQVLGDMWKRLHSRRCYEIQKRSRQRTVM